MVAAGTCVTASLGAPLLCNAAATGTFAALEGVKSQAYHQHMEAAAARRHDNIESCQQQEHGIEEKSCYGALPPPANVLSSCAGTTPVDAIARAATAISRSFPSAAAASAAVFPSAAVSSQLSSGRAALKRGEACCPCAAAAVIVAEVSPRRNSSSTSALCLIAEKTCESMQLQTASTIAAAAPPLPAADGKASVFSLSSRERAPAVDCAVCVFCRKSRSVAATPAATVGCRRSTCACDTSSSSRESNNLTIFGKKLEKPDRRGSKEDNSSCKTPTLTTCAQRCLEGNDNMNDNNNANSSSSNSASVGIGGKETMTDDGSQDRNSESTTSSNIDNSADRSTSTKATLALCLITASDAKTMTSGHNSSSAVLHERGSLHAATWQLERNKATNASCFSSAAASSSACMPATPSTRSFAGSQLHGFDSRTKMTVVDVGEKRDITASSATLVEITTLAAGAANNSVDSSTSAATAAAACAAAALASADTASAAATLAATAPAAAVVAVSGPAPAAIAAAAARPAALLTQEISSWPYEESEEACAAVQPYGHVEAKEQQTADQQEMSKQSNSALLLSPSDLDVENTEYVLRKERQEKQQQQPEEQEEEAKGVDGEPGGVPLRSWEQEYPLFSIEQPGEEHSKHQKRLQKKKRQHQRRLSTDGESSSTVPLPRGGDPATATTDAASAAATAYSARRQQQSGRYSDVVWRPTEKSPMLLQQQTAAWLTSRSHSSKSSRSRRSSSGSSNNSTDGDNPFCPRLPLETAAAGGNGVLHLLQPGMASDSSGEDKKKKQQQAEEGHESFFSAGRRVAVCISSSSSDNSISNRASAASQQQKTMIETPSLGNGTTAATSSTPNAESCDLKETRQLLWQAISTVRSSGSERHTGHSWRRSLWHDQPLVQDDLQQAEDRRRRDAEDESEGTEDVVMASASQGTDTSCGSPASVVAAEKKSHQQVVADDFSFDLWQKPHSGATGGGNNLSLVYTSKEGNTATAAPTSGALEMQRPSTVEMSGSRGVEQPTCQHLSVGGSFIGKKNTGAFPENAAQLHAVEGASKEGEEIEEDMASCNFGETGGAAVTEAFAAGTAAVTSLAEMSTVGAAGEARVDDSRRGEEPDGEQHSVLNAYLSSDEGNAVELSSSSFRLWLEQQSLVSCAVATASGVQLGSDDGATSGGEAAAAAAAENDVAAEEVAESVVSTSCSFFFSNLTDSAMDKSTSGCCAMVAGAAGDSVGLCCSSSSDDDEESGAEEDYNAEEEIGEGNCGSPRSAATETAARVETAIAVAGQNGGALLSSYTGRLLRKPLCGPDPFHHEETVFIFDWDDTLLPSSWLSQKGLTLDSSNTDVELWGKKLNAAAAHAVQTLHAARGLGRVIIVTNAETGWIDLSCSKFMPDLAPLLQYFRIVSARSAYESSCCNTPFLWKEAAFTEELRQHFPLDTQCRWNVISVGDSTHEREALFSVCGRLGQIYNVTTKSLKLLETPAVEDLHSQHELMLECLEAVAKHEGNLDLCVTSVLETAIEDDHAGTPLPAGLEGRSVGLHCLRYHPLAPEVMGRA